MSQSSMLWWLDAEILSVVPGERAGEASLAAQGAC